MAEGSALVAIAESRRSTMADLEIQLKKLKNKFEK